MGKLAVLVIVGILWFAAFASLLAYRCVVTEYEFNREVHSYMDNAYWASTPELMIDQLNKSVAGMHKLGLEPDMYASYLPWKHTANLQMNYCYAHIDAVIERCQEVIEWRDAQDLTSGQVTDVYNQKMDALRGFLKEGGWSDEIAHGAYYVNYHIIVALWLPILLALSAIVLFLVIPLIIIVADSANW